MERGGAGGDFLQFVSVSADGTHVYVAANRGVVVYERDGESGALSLVEVRPLPGARAVNTLAASPDGAHVYGELDGGVAVFARDPQTGRLTLVEVMEGASGRLAASPDGAHLYAATFSRSTLTVYERDAQTGRLSLVEVHREGVGGVDGLEGAASVAVSPDGTYVYIASTFDDALAVFRRNPSTGRLTFVEAKR